MSFTKGTYYELITAMIFQAMLVRERIRTLDIQHDVVLNGTTEHQIDIYWTFEIAGIVHTAIVQAKDWKKPVDQGELLKFCAVLEDLPGQPRGIFVARTGYQKGAREFAEKKGIDLYVLHIIKTKDLALPPKNIAFFRFDWSKIHYDNVRVIPDEEWMRAKQLIYKPKNAPINTIAFYDEEGNELITLLKIIVSYMDAAGKLTTDVHIVHNFNGETFTKSVSNNLMSKVKAIEFTLSPQKGSILAPAIPSDVDGYILEDIIRRTKREFDRLGVPKE